MLADPRYGQTAIPFVQVAPGEKDQLTVIALPPLLISQPMVAPVRSHPLVDHVQVESFVQAFCSAVRKDAIWL